MAEDKPQNKGKALGDPSLVFWRLPFMPSCGKRGCFHFRQSIGRIGIWEGTDAGGPDRAVPAGSGSDGDTDSAELERDYRKAEALQAEVMFEGVSGLCAWVGDYRRAQKARDCGVSPPIQGIN